MVLYKIHALPHASQVFTPYRICIAVLFQSNVRALTNVFVFCCISIDPPSTCQEAQRQLHKGSCQTLSNVLLLLDPISGHPQFDVYQRKLSAYLSEEILENNSNSRVSISSSSLADNPHVLNLFFSSSRKQKNPSCRVSRYVNGVWRS